MSEKWHSKVDDALQGSGAACYRPNEQGNGVNSPLLDKKTIVSSDQSARDALGGRPQCRFWKNVLFINLAVFFTNVGVSPTITLQSSVNSANGLGVLSLACSQLFMLVGAFVSGCVIRRFGCKRSIVVASFLKFLFPLANLYPTWYTMLPSAAIAGVMGTISVVGEKTYLGKLAHDHADRHFLTEKDRLQSRVFVVNMVLFKAGSVVGNLFSSIILGASLLTNGSTSSPLNFTEERYRKCGIDYCNENLTSTDVIRKDALGDAGSKSLSVPLSTPNSTAVYILFSCCAVAQIISSLVTAIFVDRDRPKKMEIIERHEKTEHVKRPTVLQDLMGVIQQLKDPKILLLIPMILVSGGVDFFWITDFTKAFVTCAIGVQFIGYITMWMGISGAFFSFTFGWFNKKQIRWIPFVVATLAQLSVLITFFFWKPDSNSYLIMSLMTVIWYMGSGTRQTALPALVAVVFPFKMDIAFSNVQVWTALGNFGVSLMSHYVCMLVKTNIIIGFLMFSFLGYASLEILLQKRKKSLNDTVTVF